MSVAVAVDLRPQFGPARDQGKRPTCLAFSDVLQRMTDGHPASHLDELLPWNWQPIRAKA
jgi:hypothetical protein